MKNWFILHVTSFMFSLASYYVLWRNLEKDLTNHICVFEPSNDSDEKDRVTPEVDI